MDLRVQVVTLIVDVFTKALSKNRFQKLRNAKGVQVKVENVTVQETNRNNRKCASAGYETRHHSTPLISPLENMQPALPPPNGDGAAPQNHPSLPSNEGTHSCCRLTCHYGIVEMKRDGKKE
ncbi:hypothetical protein OIU76_020018 [Salix suchowensis]|nr:hypothetical protein OIU76_020018 [Salix suchowensis]